MPDPAFKKLFDATDTTEWDSVDGVRERARRRTRNTRMAAAAATVVAIGVISGGVAVAQNDQSRPAPTLTTSPSPAPAPTSVPAPSSPPTPTSPPASTRPASPSSAPPSTSRSSSAPPADVTNASFLQPADIGPGYRVDNDREQGDWTFEFSATILRCERGDTVEPIERRYRFLQGDGTVSQYVAPYRSGGAARYLEQVRDRVAGCDPAEGTSVDIVDSKFAGDDALWIGVELGSGPWQHVLVRKGGTLTEFTVEGISTARIPELARKAAARL